MLGADKRQKLQACEAGCNKLDLKLEVTCHAGHGSTYRRRPFDIWMTSPELSVLGSQCFPRCMTTSGISARRLLNDCAESLADQRGLRCGDDVGKPLMLSDTKIVSVLKGGCEAYIWQMYDCLILLLTLLATALCQDGREGRKGRREEERHEGKRWKDISTHLTYSLKRCISRTKPQHLRKTSVGETMQNIHHALGEPGRC